MGPVSWSYGGNLKKKPLGNTKLPYQKSGYKAWKLEKIIRKKKLCPLTYSPFHTIFYSLCHPHQLSLLFLIPLCSSWKSVADGHRKTTDKVTGRQASRLSSYLCTPSGSRRQIHWCQTGRSGTGCWMCCSAVGELLYLNHKIYKRARVLHFLDLSLPKACERVQSI